MNIKRPLLISITLAIITFVLFSFDAFSPIDNKLYDMHFSKAKNTITNSPIVILAIDDFSIEQFKIWPWPRYIYKDLINLLIREKAKVIAFDVSFDSYTSYNTEHDLAFGEAIKEAGNVVLAREVQIRPEGIFFADPIKELRQYASTAIVHPHLDQDSFIRRYNLLVKVKDKVFPYFALEVAAKGQNITISDKTLKLGKHKIFLNGKEIPLDKQNKLLINYAGDTGTFPTIPIAKALEPEFIKLNAGIFTNKIVLIGATAKYLQDLYPTPTSLKMPGVEIHANAIMTILSRKFIHTIPHIYYLLLILIPSIIITLISWQQKAVKGLGILILIVLGIVLTSWLAFFRHIVVHVFAPVFAVFMSYLSTILLRFLREEIEKKEIKSIFNQYVSPAIVTELLTNKDKLKLGGDKKDVSIFFSDIVGFTTFSEGHSPEEVVAQLNEYLNAMTEVIIQYNGTLDKFVGDAIMAVWGAPLPQEDHALLAVRCGLKQLEVLRELQAKWKEEGRMVLDIGIGINSGEAVVGNIGAEKYKDYTVIGDVVNLASRLETYTRTVSAERGRPCQFIISEATKNKVDAFIKTAPLGDIKVKGKMQTVRIWEVLGEK